MGTDGVVSRCCIVRFCVFCDAYMIKKAGLYCWEIGMISYFTGMLVDYFYNIVWIAHICLLIRIFFSWVTSFFFLM